MSRIAEVLGADLFEFDRRHAEHTDPPAADIDDVPTDVRFHFERLALEVAARGFTHYSSDAILHRIRWHMQIDRGYREFKCNDHWTAPLQGGSSSGTRIWKASSNCEYERVYRSRNSLTKSSYRRSVISFLSRALPISVWNFTLSSSLFWS